jgi:hypothetical protein
MVSGVALAAGRGAFPASRGPVDSPAFDTARVEVVEFVNILEAAANSIWAVECGWPDVWARRLDSFALDLDDPCRQDLLDEQRFACRHAEHPFVIPEAECAGEVDKDIVKMILTDRRLQNDDSILDGHSDLMVELINLQRSRW